MKKMNKLMLVILLFGISSLANAQTEFDDDVDDVGNTVSIDSSLCSGIIAGLFIGFGYLKYKKDPGFFHR